MSVHSSHSETLPATTRDLGTRSRNSAPSRWWTQSQGSKGAPSDGGETTEGGLDGDVEDYLPYAGALFHVLHRGRRLLERKDLLDGGAQAMLRVEVEHGPELLVGAHRGAEDGEVLEEDPWHHYRHLRPGGRPEGHDTAAGLGERDHRVEGVAADVIHREVRAADHALQLPAPVFGVVVDAALRAEL